MLITLKKRILDPKHEGIQRDRNYYHHYNKFQLRMPVEDRKNGIAPGNQRNMIHKLEEEDENLRQKCAHAPYDNLQEPYPNINSIVRVYIIITINWHTLIRIYSTF